MQTGSRIREEDVNERWPDLPDDLDLAELDPEVRRDLRGLSAEGSQFVGGHLLAAVELAEDEPETAWHHARAARSRGGRIAVVRETVGLVAYRAGQWSEAVAELRAARRMAGGPGHLAVMADCERALGNPEKAIELSRSAEAEQLDPDAQLELRIVVAAARADLGQLDAALVHLEAAGARPDGDITAPARLLFAYADLLEQAGRRDEAIAGFLRAANADVEEETDAEERLALLTQDDATSDEVTADEVTAEQAAELTDGDAGENPEAELDGAEQDGAELDGADESGADQDDADQDSAEQDSAEGSGAEQDGAEQVVSAADVTDADVSAADVTAADVTAADVAAPIEDGPVQDDEVTSTGDTQSEAAEGEGAVPDAASQPTAHAAAAPEGGPEDGDTPEPPVAEPTAPADQEQGDAPSAGEAEPAAPSAAPGSVTASLFSHSGYTPPTVPAASGDTARPASAADRDEDRT